MSEVTRDLTSDDPISVPVDKLESLYNSFHAEGIKGYVKDARTNVVEKQAFVDFVNKYYYPMRQKKHDLIYGSKHLPFESIEVETSELNGNGTANVKYTIARIPNPQWDKEKFNLKDNRLLTKEEVVDDKRRQIPLYTEAAEGEKSTFVPELVLIKEIDPGQPLPKLDDIAYVLAPSGEEHRIHHMIGFYPDRTKTNSIFQMAKNEDYLRGTTNPFVKMQQNDKCFSQLKYECEAQFRKKWDSCIEKFKKNGIDMDAFRYGGGYDRYVRCFHLDEYAIFNYSFISKLYAYFVTYERQGDNQFGTRVIKRGDRAPTRLPNGPEYKEFLEWVKPHKEIPPIRKQKYVEATRFDLEDYYTLKFCAERGIFGSFMLRDRPTWYNREKEEQYRQPWSEIWKTASKAVIRDKERSFGQSVGYRRTKTHFLHYKLGHRPYFKSFWFAEEYNKTGQQKWKRINTSDNTLRVVPGSHGRNHRLPNYHTVRNYGSYDSVWETDCYLERYLVGNGKIYRIITADWETVFLTEIALEFRARTKNGKRNLAYTFEYDRVIRKFMTFVSEELKYRGTNFTWKDKVKAMYRVREICRETHTITTDPRKAIEWRERRLKLMEQIKGERDPKFDTPVIKTVFRKIGDLYVIVRIPIINGNNANRIGVALFCTTKSEVGEYSTILNQIYQIQDTWENKGVPRDKFNGHEKDTEKRKSLLEMIHRSGFIKKYAFQDAVNETFETDWNFVLDWKGSSDDLYKILIEKRDKIIDNYRPNSQVQAERQRRKRADNDFLAGSDEESADENNDIDDIVKKAGRTKYSDTDESDESDESEWDSDASSVDVTPKKRTPRKTRKKPSPKKDSSSDGSSADEDETSSDEDELIPPPRKKPNKKVFVISDDDDDDEESPKLPTPVVKQAPPRRMPKGPLPSSAPSRLPTIKPITDKEKKKRLGKAKRSGVGAARYGGKGKLTKFSDEWYEKLDKDLDKELKNTPARKKRVRSREKEKGGSKKRTIDARFDQSRIDEIIYYLEDEEYIHDLQAFRDDFPQYTEEEVEEGLKQYYENNGQPKSSAELKEMMDALGELSSKMFNLRF